MTVRVAEWFMWDSEYGTVCYTNVDVAMVTQETDVVSLQTVSVIMSIYKQSVLPKFTWLWRIIIAIVATGELCLKIPLSLKQWLIRCLGDDIKSVQTSAWDFASFILYSCLHWLSGNITDGEDVLVIWLKYATFSPSFLWMNVKTSYYLRLSSPVFCSSGDPSISPSAAAGQRNPGSLPGCSEV